MLWLNFLINASVFMLVFNITRLTSWYRTRRWEKGNPAFTIFLPVSLALLLTVIDSIRLFFAYQLAIFIAGAIGLYWLSSKLSRLPK